MKKIFTKAVIMTAITTIAIITLHLFREHLSGQGKAEGADWLARLDNLIAFSFLIMIAVVVGKSRVTESDRGWLIGAIGSLSAMYTVFSARNIAIPLIQMMRFANNPPQDEYATLPDISISSIADYILFPGAVLLSAVVFLLLKKFETLKFLVFVLLVNVTTYTLVFLYGIIFPGFMLNEA